jgi:hypothetical protein
MSQRLLDEFGRSCCELLARFVERVGSADACRVFSSLTAAPVVSRKDFCCDAAFAHKQPRGAKLHDTVLWKTKRTGDDWRSSGDLAASGGRADDLGKLRAGEFYFATDGSGKPVKVRAPICLSFHPPNPPTPEEVIALAKPKRR